MVTSFNKTNRKSNNLKSYSYNLTEYWRLINICIGNYYWHTDKLTRIIIINKHNTHAKNKIEIIYKQTNNTHTNK